MGPEPRLIRTHVLWLLPLITALTWGATAPPARAQGCEDCEAPTVEEILRGTRVELRWRSGDIPLSHARDYMQMDAGACLATLASDPVVQKTDAYLVVRGEGEVWDCPHSKSVDTVTVETSTSDSTSWTFTTKVGVKLKSVAAEVSAEISAGRSQGETIKEVTRIAKTITPGACHRIQWKGKFEVATYEAHATYVFEQVWAWWTKNATTGATVHAKGTLKVPCGSADVVLSRDAPIAGFFELSQSACGGEGCGHVVTKHLGHFPQLPPYLRPAEPKLPAPDDEDDEAQPDPLPPDAPPSSGTGTPDSGDLPPPPSAPDPDAPPAGPVSDPYAGTQR